MVRRVQPMLLVAVAGWMALGLVTDARADCESCLPSFTKVPDYVVSGDGTCVHGGLGPGGGPPSDVLEITVPDIPKCHPCTVEVTAVWGPGAADMESKTKGPGDHVTPVGDPPAPYWPHRV